MARLPCGCDPGYHHCAMADVLWAAVNAAYRAWRASGEEADWEAYRAAYLEYDAHVAEGY